MVTNYTQAWQAKSFPPLLTRSMIKKSTFLGDLDEVHKNWLNIINSFACAVQVMNTISQFCVLLPEGRFWSKRKHHIL